ncbi:MAG: glycine/sarcosine/betaine reductase component B subunit [SAR202 cluster bacterium]|jgi:glycine reductase|nr:glycine/sarcosine/betaine reductase component B subunit [SAR202 cluster bacterium]
MLEVGAFPVESVVSSDVTRWRDGTLEVNEEELVDLVRQDERIPWASVEVANPGEKVRIINDYDIIEPRVKVDGTGQTFPAIAGRLPGAVGQGRTHTLGSCALVGCVDVSEPMDDDPGQKARSRSPGLTNYKFIDMSGPGAVTHSGQTPTVCVTIGQAEGASSEYWHSVAQAAFMRVSDRLAETTVGHEPPSAETFDTTPRPGLPGVVSVFHMSSLELYRGPYTKVGTAVYGITRAAPPWVLEPTELLDGAIAQIRTRMYTNNPLNLKLLRGHGIDWNYLACMAYPTNWSMQEEKAAVSGRVARTAKMLGAEGAIITTDVRGQRMVETMLTIQACEQEGIKVVFMSEEEDPEDGKAPPFLTSVPELSAVVSTGTGGWEGPFPAVERVLGARSPEQRWFDEQPPVHGRYAVSHLGDHYGYGNQSYADW